MKKKYLIIKLLKYYIREILNKLLKYYNILNRKRFTWRLVRGFCRLRKKKLDSYQAGPGEM